MPPLPVGQVPPPTAALRPVTSEMRLAHQLPRSLHQRHGDRENPNGADDSPRRFIAGSQVGSRYSITDMTLCRWLNDPAIRVSTADDGREGPALLART
jgi:hypothetical protein